MADAVSVDQTSELGLLKLPRRRDIDGLRGVAVLAVLGYHFLPDVFHSGLLGVDVFFVISGYVITNLLVREIGSGSFSILSFWMFRVRRLFPALLAVLATALIAGWFLLWPVDFQHLGAQVIWSAAFMGNIGQLRNSSYFDGDLITKPLAHLWSLGVEEQFYLAWPLLLLLLVGVLSLRRIMPAIGVLIGMSWFACVIVGFSDPASAFFLPWFRAWELLTGALIAVALSHVRGQVKFRSSRNVVGAGAVVLLVVSFILPIPNQNPGLYALATVILTGAVIWLGVPGGWSDRLLTPVLLVWFGAISYPLYLWHWLVLSLAVGSGADQTNYLTMAALMGVSIAAAYATSRFLEPPFRTKTPTKTMIFSLLGAMGAIMLAAASVVYFQGFPSRLSGVQRSLSEFTYDHATAYRLGTCFIEDGQSLAPDCLEADDVQPRVLLWGDSHAAHLYPGISGVGAGAFAVEQATTSSCPPALPEPETQTATCFQSNTEALSYALSGKPDVIVLAANWYGYEQQRLSQLIAELRRESSSKIVVVGPVPYWVSALPKALAATMSPGQEVVPGRSWELVRPGYSDVDSVARQTAIGAGADYLDSKNVLCNAEGCLTHANEDQLALTSWDEAHLTTEGSLLLARAMQEAGLLPQSAQFAAG